MLGPTARGELMSPQTGMGVHAAVVGHCAVTTLCEGVVPVLVLLYPWDVVPQVAAVSPHSQVLPDQALTLSLGNGP